MRTRLEVVGVIAALLVGVAVPAALAQDGDAPVWSKCDARGRCVFQVHGGLFPVLDEAAIDEMNARAAELAAFLEEAGIEHGVLTLDVVTWDRSDPEANRAVARFWRRMLPGLPGEGFVPWPVPDRWDGRGGRVLEFEGIWPGDLLPFLEEVLGEEFPFLEGLPFFDGGPWDGRLPVPRGPLGGDRGEGTEPERIWDLFDEDRMQPGLMLEDLGRLLEEILGAGEGDRLLPFIEEFFAGEGPLGLGEILAAPGGRDLVERAAEAMAALAGYMESRGIDFVTIDGPLGIGWVVWDFFDEEASGAVAEFFTDRWLGTGGETQQPGDDGERWEVPEWGWPFDGRDR